MLSVLSSSLTLERSGTFTIHTYGNNHCGTLSNLKINYKLICECESKLDTRGFLFDQLRIDTFLKSITSTSNSCESLTIDSLIDLLAMIQVENPNCIIKKASLTLSPEPFAASMTYKVRLKKTNILAPRTTPTR